MQCPCVRCPSVLQCGLSPSLRPFLSLQAQSDTHPMAASDALEDAASVAPEVSLARASSVAWYECIPQQRRCRSGSTCGRQLTQTASCRKSARTCEQS